MKEQKIHKILTMLIDGNIKIQIPQAFLMRALYILFLQG